MESFLEAVKALNAGPEARRAADTQLQVWQRSAEAWADTRIAIEAQNIPQAAQLLAAQTMRRKVLLDLDQVPPAEIEDLRQTLLHLCEVAADKAHPIVVQCALAITDFALQTEWGDIIEHLIVRWGDSSRHWVVLLAVLVGVIEERNHPLLPLRLGETWNDAFIGSHAPVVSAWLSRIDVSDPHVQRASLQCARCWIPWAIPSAEWVQMAAGCLGRDDDVGDEAANALVDATHAAELHPGTHGHLVEAVYLAVSGFIGVSKEKASRVASRVLHVAVEAGNVMLPSIIQALENGHSDAQCLLASFAAAVADDLGSASNFFGAFAGALIGHTAAAAIAAPALKDALVHAVGELETGNEDALQLCEAVANALGPADAVAVLMNLPLSCGRTWGLSKALWKQPPAVMSPDADMVWMELERATATVGPAEAALLCRAGRWVAARPNALPAVVAALLEKMFDAEVYGLVIDAGVGSAACTQILVKSAPGRPCVCSAAVMAARNLNTEEFKVALDELIVASALAHDRDKDNALRCMVAVVAGLRGTERSPHLRTAASEAIARVSAMAWAALLQPEAVVGGGSAEAALDVLSVTISAGHAALPDGGITLLASTLTSAFKPGSCANPSMIADALALLLREFGRDTEAEGTLGSAVRSIVAEGLTVGWDTSSAQFRPEGEDHIAAAWVVAERALRHAPYVARGLFGGEMHCAACFALAVAHPNLAMPAIGFLGAWLEDEPNKKEMEQVWVATFKAIRLAPPATILEALPGFLESLRDCCGLPETLPDLLTATFGACTTVSRLEAVASALEHGSEKTIEAALTELAHCVRRIVARNV